MTVTLSAKKYPLSVHAIPSKSEAHRYLIAAALASGDMPIHIVCGKLNKDIEATASCLAALGAKIEYKNGSFSVTPIDRDNIPKSPKLHPGESGSTLRFLLPLVAALGCGGEFYMEGRLPERPLSPLSDLLEENGIAITYGNPLKVSGKLECGDYSISGGVSSQFVTGMIFALSVIGGTLTVTGKVESKGYIDITVRALSEFSSDIREEGNVFTLSGCELKREREIIVGGDYSNAAFFLVSGAIGSHPVTVSGLDPKSAQGDREIVDILAEMGADIERNGDTVTVSPSKLTGAEIDASNIPDLVPILSVAAMAAEGKTVIYNAERLRLKESDRIESVATLIKDIGGKVNILSDGLEIFGHLPIGGVADSAHDHRIAMSAAVSSLIAKDDVIVFGAEAVDKSYPDFWEDFAGIKRKREEF